MDNLSMIPEKLSKQYPKLKLRCGITVRRANNIIYLVLGTKSLYFNAPLKDLGNIFGPDTYVMYITCIFKAK